MLQFLTAKRKLLLYGRESGAVMYFSLTISMYSLKLTALFRKQKSPVFSTLPLAHYARIRKRQGCELIILIVSSLPLLKHVGVCCYLLYNLHPSRGNVPLSYIGNPLSRLLPLDGVRYEICCHIPKIHSHLFLQ